MKYRAVLLVSVALFLSLASGVSARRQAPARVAANADAITLNNLGVASMNQQKPEVALERFEAAAKADPSLVAARVNQAIAMTALQRYEPAQQILDARREGRPVQRPRLVQPRPAGAHARRQRRGAGGLHARDGARPHRPVRALFRRPDQQPGAAARQGDRRRSRARSSSIRSWSRPSSAWRARISAAGRPTTPRRTWIGSRG